MIMGDHSKTGINTMINTGSVIGVGVNLFGPGFTRNFVPSFSWGGSNGFTEHKFNMFKETSIRVMKRRNKCFDENQSNLYETVFDMTNAIEIIRSAVNISSFLKCIIFAYVIYKKYVRNFK